MTSVYLTKGDPEHWLNQEYRKIVGALMSESKRKESVGTSNPNKNWDCSNHSTAEIGKNI